MSLPDLTENGRKRRMKKRMSKDVFGLKSSMKYLSKIGTILALVALVAGVGGCSRFFGPSDQEILKAINASEKLKQTIFTVSSPIVIVDKGKRNPDGSWPVRVKMKITYTRHKDTDTWPAEQEIDPTFKIYKMKDDKGNTIWKAEL
jgi:hypothetical protein